MAKRSSLRKPVLRPKAIGAVATGMTVVEPVVEVVELTEVAPMPPSPPVAEQSAAAGPTLAPALPAPAEPAEVAETVEMALQPELAAGAPSPEAPTPALPRDVEAAVPESLPRPEPEQALTCATAAEPVQETECAPEPFSDTPPPESAVALCSGLPPSISPEERQRRVEQVAYFLAEQRGFAPGNETEDWARAEAQVAADLGER